MSKIRFNDLPRELLDEICSYVIPEINENAIIPLQTVCRRWNRPFMTHTLWNKLIPQNIDLQTRFPKLACFAFFSDAKYCKDFSFFKGHAFLKELLLSRMGLVHSVLNCPRLKSLTLYITSRLFFKDDNLEILLALLPRLEHLNVTLFYGEESYPPIVIEINHQRLAKIIQKRATQPRLKLKSLEFSCPDENFVAFCQLFQTPSLDHFESLIKLSAKQVRTILEYFPITRSLQIGVTSLPTDSIFESVTTLRLQLRTERETFALSALMHLFPNVESLEVLPYPIFFDLKYPTRLTYSKMFLVGPIDLRMFSHLMSLEWTIDKSQFNFIMRKLANHCPHLSSIKIFPTMCQVGKAAKALVPKLDVIVFSRLETFEMGGACVMFNLSFSQFLVRHGQLQRFKCRNNINLAHNWQPIKSHEIAWPHMRVLELCALHRRDFQRKDQFRNWFVKNAPNVTDLNFDFKN